MTEKEFLRRISYSINVSKKELTIWYNQQSLSTISFEDNPKKLEDDFYLTELSYEVALESSLNKLIL